MDPILSIVDPILSIMDPALKIVHILGIARQLYTLCSKVKANKKRCQRLVKRVKTLEVIVTSVRDPEAIQCVLKELKGTLEAAHKVVEKYTEAGFLNRIVQAYDLDKEFESLNDRLNETSQQLSLSLQIDQREMQTKQQEVLIEQRKMLASMFAEARCREEDLADKESDHKELKMYESIERAQKELKTDLKRKYECIFDVLAKRGRKHLLYEMYTALYITEGGSGRINNEHEVRQIETASKSQTTPDTSILCNDIFKPLPGQKNSIRTVLTMGIAGIGKTVSVQKFILDWADGIANHDVDFIFPLPFRDLNLKKETIFSLMKLIKCYFPQLREIESVEGHKFKVVFIFDGLDECRLPLNFQRNENCCNVTDSSSMDVLLTNLIKGELLPSALIWITSRPAAVSQIPPEYVDLVTEVQGFNNPQKEEYFRKRIRDQDQARTIISHIKSSRSLDIMCHIPVFCSISATVLETMLGKVGGGDPPKTLTEMYTRFLLIQTNLKNLKYGTSETIPTTSASDTEIILKLGKLAFLQLEKGNLIFYEEDLRESGIDVSEASVYSGVCTEIFKEECVLDQKKVYSFVHLSIQEYLAALFVFHACVNKNRNVLRAEESNPNRDRVQLSEVHMTAVDQALESKNGHLDLFLRFLLGLSLESIQELLGGLLTQTDSRSPVPELQKQTGSRSHVPEPQTQTGSRSPVPNTQAQARRRSDGGRWKNNCMCTIFQRLWTQTGSRSTVPDEEAQIESRSESIEKTVQYIKERIREESSAERTINLFHCLNELNDNSLVEEIKKFQESGKLSVEHLEPHQCSALTFVLLMSKEIQEFDLKTYNTSDAGRQRLVPVIRNCKKAILNSCNLTEKSCDIVASALQLKNSPLIDLDLSYNDLGDSGVKLLCAGLMSPNCKLQRLGLNSCTLTEKSCSIVASALQSSNSPLRYLDLSCNNLVDSGVKQLCVGLLSPNCKLQRLGLNSCKLTEKSCSIVASALQSSHLPLRYLDLSCNNLGDSGVELLCVGLMSPNCKLQRLGLNGCHLTEKSCDIVASALQSSNSPLRDLDLSYNNLEDSGVELLCAGLMSPNCKLKRLGLGWCNLTEGCCDVLASVLHCPHSELRDLELRDNELQDSGVRVLSAGLEDPYCKLRRLGLSGCRVTQRGCDSLASALYSNPSYMRELDLRYNHPGDSGVRVLSAAKLDSLTLLVDHGGENMTKPGPRKYGCRLTLDPNTAHRELSLSEGNRKVAHTWGREEEPYPDHPERFQAWEQVVCRECVSERCYWEAEFRVHRGGSVYIAVTDKGISRKGAGCECWLGHNKNSWSLKCRDRDGDGKLSYHVWHNEDSKVLHTPLSPYCGAAVCDGGDDGGVCVYRVGVCVDRPAGTLSFYSVSDSDALTLLHRFHTHFTQHTTLCAGFRVVNSLVSLCQLE